MTIQLKCNNVYLSNHAKLRLHQRGPKIRPYQARDCFAEGEAQFHGRKAKVLAPVPGYDYSGIDHNKTLNAWNEK